MKLFRQRTISRLLACMLVSVASVAWADDSSFAQAEEAIDNHEFRLALHLYRQAADQGDPEAARSAGLMLLYGERLYGTQVKGDRMLAQHYLRRAALRGCEVSAALLQKMANRG